MDDRTSTARSRRCCPGSTFEVNAVLADPKLAGMEVSIEWPYGSNLHCEILVDDQIVAQADQFIAPRLLRAKDDPLYGMLQCGAPLDIPAPRAASKPRPADPGRSAPPRLNAPPPAGLIRYGRPPGGVGPFPGAPVGVGEPGLLGLGVVRRGQRVTLDRQILFAHTGIGLQPVGEQQRELLIRPAVDPEVDWPGRPGSAAP